MYFTQGLHRAVQQRGTEVATVYNGRYRTWNEVADRVARLAAGLRSLGLQTGDRVAIIAHNSDWYVESFLAISWAGGVVIPGNTRWALAEHIQALGDATPRILIVDPAFAGASGPIAEAAGATAVIHLDDGPAPEGLVAVETLIETSEPMADACGRDDDLAALFYTGGTTGRPKGVMLSHANVISNIWATTATSAGPPRPITLQVAPLYHIAGAWMLLRITMQAGTQVLLPGFSVESVTDAIEREKCTEVFLVPTMIGMMHQYLADKQADFSAVLDFLYGTSPITEARLAQAVAMFPNAKIRQMFGQTEMGCLISMLEPEFHTPRADGKSYLRSAGRILFGVDVRIVDEQLQDLPVGQVGELMARSDGVMLGYWNQPEQTAKTILDGWVRTGDGAYLDEEGFLYVVDRIKDMIVSGGENVYSLEVENALSAHPHVTECAVFGVPDDRWGERVHAVVCIAEGESVDQKELVAHCRTLIAAYKIPRSIDFSDVPLPKSGAGKIVKADIRKAYWVGSTRGVN